MRMYKRYVSYTVLERLKLCFVLTCKELEDLLEIMDPNISRFIFFIAEAEIWPFVILEILLIFKMVFKILVSCLKLL